MKKKYNPLKAVLYLAGVIFFFMYLFNKADLLPDPLPVFGFLDDAIIFFLGLWLIAWLTRKFKLGGKK